ncbi:unnamed protein product [Nippostrongylus brasiliensis]|uniref:GLOBIN domain-containing protein n=1 Tax=Nippostrongylus brasiliensis TaxID=27835 RepID=A0A0N4YK28_NIPBR|nr:unnamed protein product [Nippostrongylus brasiliensis]
MRRGISTDSLDSAASSLLEVNREVPTASLTLKYDEATQMLSVQLHHLTDVYSDYGQIWLLFFLLPHPKPLWRTEARSTPSSFIDYSTVYQQCVRKGDLNKSPSDEPVDNVKLGDVLFLASFSHDRMTVIVSKVRNIPTEYKTVFVRLYIVQPMGQVTKKKTSERVLVGGAADIGESMFFNKSHLRLSIVCGNDEFCKSIGHVTLGPKANGKNAVGAGVVASRRDTPESLDCTLMLSLAHLTEIDKDILIRSWNLVSRKMEALAVDIFEMIFEQAPDAKLMFVFMMRENNEDEKKASEFAFHALRFMQVIESTVNHLEDPETLDPLFLNLGKLHARHEEHLGFSVQGVCASPLSESNESGKSVLRFVIARMKTGLEANVEIRKANRQEVNACHFEG